MKTNEDHHAASFGQLLRHDLAEPWVWLKPLRVGLISWILWQSGAFGVYVLIVLCVVVAVISAGLVRRTPWCCDTAFWRTRPISRATLFAVKSIEFMLLCVVPALGVALIEWHDLDRFTWMAALFFGVAGLIAVTSASASAAAIESLGGPWKVLGWQAFIGAPVLSSILFGVAGSCLPIPTPSGIGGIVSGMIVGVGLIAVGALAAWIAVGLKGRVKIACVILTVAGLTWPWVAGTFQGDFFRVSESDPVVLKIEKGESLLNMPIHVVELEKGEWFVPSRIQVARKGKQEFFSQSQIFRSSGAKPSPHTEVRVFSRDHWDFSVVMDVEKLWEIPRSILPKHTNWVPTDKVTDFTHAAFELPEASMLTSPGASIRLFGSRYRFVSSEPVNLNSKKMPISIHDGLAVTKCEIPNSSAVDVTLRMKRSVLQGASRWDSNWSVVPPEVWGILYHEKSNTAYGTASWRVHHRSNGLRKVFVVEDDLILRFELPRMESALLGVDPRKVLSESVLYLFEVENLGPATAE